MRRSVAEEKTGNGIKAAFLAAAVLAAAGIVLHFGTTAYLSQARTFQSSANKKPAAKPLSLPISSKSSANGSMPAHPSQRKQPPPSPHGGPSKSP